MHLLSTDGGFKIYLLHSRGDAEHDESDDEQDYINEMSELSTLLLSDETIKRVNELIRKYKPEKSEIYIGCEEHHMRASTNQNRKQKNKKRTGVVIGVCEHGFVCTDSMIIIMYEGLFSRLPL
jgi:hypothetical protein